MVTCSAPITDDSGSIWGVATVDLKLDSIAAFFEQAAQETEGYVFAVDRDNRLITFPHANFTSDTRVLSSQARRFKSMAEVANYLPPTHRFAII